MATRTVTVRFFSIQRTDDASWTQDPRILIESHSPAEGPGDRIKIGAREYLVERGTPTTLKISALNPEANLAVAREGVTHPFDLDDDEEIAMQTHVGFFPGDAARFDKRVVAMIRSTLTPGHSQVSNVLGKMCDDKISLIPLARYEPASMILKSQGVTKLHVRFGRDAATLLDSASSVVGEGARQIASLSSVGEVDMVLRIQEDGQVDWRGRMIRFAEALAGWTGTKPKVDVHIVDEEGDRQVVDLIEDDLSRKVPVEIEDGGHRELTAETAAKAMTTAYNRMADEVGKSLARLGVDD